MADLPSILGGMAQGFLDFGKSAVDLFGTGGAAVGDLVDTIRTGKVSTKNQDDFRKWLYNTDSVQDAAAKGLGTALNGVQTVTDYIPGIGAVTKNPLFNAGQGALGGLADEFKTYGKDYDLGRAGERAAVSAGAALASGSLGDALKKSANPLLSSGAVQGLARGATSGAISGGGYAAIDGGDVMQSALQGAGTGALIGGATGVMQDFTPRKATYDMALTDEEKAARIANAQNMLANEQNPERIAELNNQIKDLGGTLANADMAVNSPKLTPEQEEFFKDSVIRDANGNLMPMYHGTKGDFTVFSHGKSNGTSNNNSSVGFWFTPTEKNAKNWAESTWYGSGEPKAMETYLNMKNPKIYESVDNSEAVAKLRKELDSLRFEPKNLSDTSFYHRYPYDSYTAMSMLEDGDANTVLKWLTGKGYDSDKAAEYIDELVNLNKLNSRRKSLQDSISDLKYGDAYERFRTDLYKVDGQTAEDANLGGIGMALNDMDTIQKYVDGLKSEGYDGILIKGTNYDADVMGGPNDQYVVFDSNQIKDINNLKPTDAPSIMESRIAPEELDLARALSNQDLSVNNAKIAPGQLGLFDQPMPTKPVEEALTLDGRYSPKDNKVTKAMRARAEEIMGDYKTSKKVPENELYNKIDESTLPNKRKSTGAILDDLYSKGIKPDEVSNKVLDQLVEKEIGGKMDKKGLATYLFGDMDDTARKDFIKKNLYTTKDYDVDDLTESILKNWARRKAMASGTLNKYNIDNLAIVGGNKTVRQGYTGALDSALSERLGIAPGNTYKQNGEFDTPGALGRYIGSESRPDFNNYMVKEVPDIEEALNTAGHERLHSFQAESRLDNRYSKEVADAYNGLASDLKKANAYKSDAEIKNRYKKGTEYWGDTDEQEARMLQQYLGARGFTDYNKRDARMYGELEFDNDKIVPAFDKFFDKLRDLSKRGVALPALAALFGGGAYMASQNNDKEKEVK